ncbi:hypothetical protein JAF83_004644 [Citrobacter werkmanii]|nr:hypothetical protein [Citrobacter werkmanii]
MKDTNTPVKTSAIGRIVLGTLGGVLLLQSFHCISGISTNSFATRSGTITQSAMHGGYWFSSDSLSSGVNWTEGSNSTYNWWVELSSNGGFDTVYVPSSGDYFLRLHVCSASGPSLCSLAKSTYYIDGASDKHHLYSNKLIVDHNFLFIVKQFVSIGPRSSFCYTFVDSSGREWSAPSMITCQDANKLPESPAMCYLNSSEDLSVTLGRLERGSIATAPAMGASTNVKKDVPILCTGDASTTVSTTFQYTPLTFNGHEVISVKNSGFGVAVFYKGLLVGPSSVPITETFAPGYTSRKFEFQAVRDPNIALKDIPTGNFSASATMVMTQQ